MVSMAGGMARFGLLPVCHSFACFLSTRPNEQIYNNATERSKVIYVASLAGLLPAGPGHSHQGVRDVNALSAVPNLVMFAPSHEAAVADGLAWAVHETRSSVWLRLESVPWHLPFSPPPEQKLREGVGAVLRDTFQKEDAGETLSHEATEDVRRRNNDGIDFAFFDPCLEFAKVHIGSYRHSAM